MSLGYLPWRRFFIAITQVQLAESGSWIQKIYALSPIFTVINCEKGKKVNALVKMWIAVVSFRLRMKILRSSRR